jgi:hypothetical protein
MQFKNLEKKVEKIGNIEKEIMYNILEDLPSNKRSYPDIGKIYVRGLFFGEVTELSRINEDSLQDTLKVYRDAIKFENSNYKLEDLELVDYILLTSIVNIMTTPDFKWYLDFKCSNLIRNPKLTQLEIEKEGIEATIEDLEEKYSKEEDETIKEKIQKDLNLLKEELAKIVEKIENFNGEEIVECGANVSTPITIEDFEIEIIDPSIIFPVYYNFSGQELELKALNIQDEIELDEYTELNPDIAYLAKHIKNMDFNDAYNLLKMSMPWEVEELEKYIERFNIELKPFLAKCPRCGKEYDLYIDLKDIKVLPHL